MKDALICFLALIGVIVVPMLVTAMFELSFMVILGITLDVVVKSTIWFIMLIIFGGIIIFGTSEYFEQRDKNK